jgi:hypothetical protein
MNKAKNKHADIKSHNVKINVISGIPLAFSGKFWGVPFKTVAQYNLLNEVDLIIEEKNTGEKITILTGNNNEKAINDLANYILKNSKQGNLKPYFYKVNIPRYNSNDTGVIFSDNEYNAAAAAKRAVNAKGYDIPFNAKTKITELSQEKTKNILIKDIESLIKSFNKEVRDHNNNVKTNKPKMKALPPAKKEKKAPIKKKKRQTGKSNILIDMRVKAKPPGKRKSANGKIYYEYRKNRSDKPGQLTGINKKFIDPNVLKFYK